MRKLTEQIHEIIYADKSERMFPFITHTTNPIGGGLNPGVRGTYCPYDCDYCWATGLKERHKWDKYRGDWRLIEKELKRYSQGDFVFVQDMGEIGHPSISGWIIDGIMGWMSGNYQARFLTLTKNPGFYLRYRNGLPENVVLGATVETDMNTSDVSDAPHPYARLTAMEKLQNRTRNRLFISIEPIMRFSPHLKQWIEDIKPWAVAVGYDNYGNGLPEPSLEETKQLIQQLSEFTTVYVKTLREAWNQD